MTAPERWGGRPGERRLELSPKRAAIGLALAAVLALGTLTLIGRVAEFDEVIEAWRTSEPRWLALGPLGLAIAFTGYVMAYRDFARAGGGPALGPVIAARVVAVGFGAMTLGSAPGGLAVDYWALRRAGAGAHESARRVLGFNTMEWLVLGGAAAAAGALALIGAAEGIPPAMAEAWLVAVPLCCLAALWVSAPSRAGRLARPRPPHRPPPRASRPRRAAARVAGGLRVGFADAVGGLVVMRAVLGRPRRYLAGVTGFGVYWAGQLLILWAALRAFDESLGPVPMVLAFATGYAATALPLPLGGAGGVEASLAFSLHAVGAELSAATLAVLAYRVVTFWLPILPALLAARGIPRLHHELLPAVRREGAGAAGAEPEPLPAAPRGGGGGARRYTR